MILEAIFEILGSIPPYTYLFICYLLLLGIITLFFGGLYYICHADTKSAGAFIISGLTVPLSIFTGIVLWFIDTSGQPDYNYLYFIYPFTPADIAIIGIFAGILLYIGTVIFNKIRWGRCYPWHNQKEKIK